MHAIGRICLALVIILFVVYMYIHYMGSVQTNPARTKSYKYDSDFKLALGGRKSLTRTPIVLTEEYIGADQRDVKLIEAIRKDWLMFPSPGPLKLRQPKKLHYSQTRQSEIVDKLLNGKRSGFFVECGAGNGEQLSNSLFFEKSRNWSGLLVEANPASFNELVSKKRKAFILNACLSTSPQSAVMPFTFANVLGGLTNHIEEGHMKRIRKVPNVRNHDITCFPLFSILRALNVSHIDYFSLDVEGAEFEILQTIPWHDISISVLTVEYFVSGCSSCTQQKMAHIRQLMEETGQFEEQQEEAFNWLDLLFVRV